MAEGRLNRFYAKLCELKDWPDRDIIMALSSIAKEDINLAPTFAQMIIQRLLDPGTNSSYRRPLFYLIDSIMKTVGGPYAVIFEGHLTDTYSMTLKDIHHPEDIKKLDFLFTTWEERRFLSGNLLAKMKYQLRQPQLAVHTRAQPIMQQQQPPYMMNNGGFFYGPGQARPNPQMVSQQPPQQYSHQPQVMPSQPRQLISQPTPQSFPPVQHSQPQSMISSNLPTNQPVIDRHSSIYLDLVRNEMINLLNQLLQDLNTTERMTLEEISIQDPILYQQLLSNAEVSAEEILRKKMLSSATATTTTASSTSSNVNHFASHFDNHSGMSMQMDYSNPVVNRKRSLPEDIQFLPQNKHAALSHPNQQLRDSPMRANAHPFFPGSGGATHTNNNIAAQSLNQLFVQDQSSIQPPTGTSMPPYGDSIPQAAQPLLPTPQPQGHFVNGYINETPVVVDIERVRNVAEQLDPSVSTNSYGFNHFCQQLADNLQSYLQNIQIPPALPSILFGPLPVAPLYQSITTAAVQAVAAVTRKLPIPEFKISDLSKRPDQALKALYIDRPHQFHEDGLRFKSLVELRSHTDKYLNLKKVSLKLKDNKEKRESREWYCTLSNWISDFDALNRKNSQLNKELDGNHSNHNNNSSSGMNAGANRSSGGKGLTVTNSSHQPTEEYIVPADENFTRCPISREVFATVWDDEEGEMMFRNAVKVLVTEAADPTLFKYAKPIPSDSLENPLQININHMKYMIVHKPLIMDRWLTEGKAVTVKDAIARYESLGDKGRERIAALKVAAGDDEEEFEDIFTILEY